MILLSANFFFPEIPMTPFPSQFSREKDYGPSFRPRPPTMPIAVEISVLTAIDKTQSPPQNISPLPPVSFF